MRFGHLKNTDLEGHKTIKDWLLAKIDAAELTAPEYTKIVFITPLTDSRYTIYNLAKFKKLVSRCAGFGPVATRNAQKRLSL